MRIPVCLLVLLLLLSPCHAADVVLHEARVAVYFSPRGGAEDAIVSAVGSAQRSIRVLAYSFTSKSIATALVAAGSRGVDVEIIVDKGQPNAKGGQAQAVAGAGIPVLVDRAHAIAHNKVMIIDDVRLVTGSFNFTQGAETRNAENLLVFDAPELAAQYLADYARHREHAQPLQ